MDGLVRDLRFAVRGLLRTPGFTAAAVLALALGIGATTAIFSVVNAVLLRSLGWGEEVRLVSIYRTFEGIGKGKGTVSVPELYELHRSWGGGKRNSTTVSLSPLPPDDTAPSVE